jgi:hypothetical protein
VPKNGIKRSTRSWAPPPPTVNRNQEAKKSATKPHQASLETDRYQQTTLSHPR